VKIETDALQNKYSSVDIDILIESTKSFEDDINGLSVEIKNAVVQKINDCTALFPTQKVDVYRKLRRLQLNSNLNGYESSLYTLKVSPQIRVILTVDEDPIFRQVIFTLFRVVKHDELDRAYRGIAESLYQEMVHQDREIAQIF
jgi:hypothetical protein